MLLPRRRDQDDRRPRAQTAELSWSPLQWWMDDTRMMVETRLRVLHGLPIATTVEGHHMSAAMLLGAVRAART